MTYQTSTRHERVQRAVTGGRNTWRAAMFAESHLPRQCLPAGRSPHPTRRRPMKMSLMFAAICAALPASVLADMMVGAELQGFQEVPAVSSKASGRVRLRINRQSDFIDYKLSYSG